MENGKNISDMDSGAAANAVSIYNQDAMDDFPVLKAFQQYIDAEQAKAQKRTMTLCIFFAVLMAIVIGVFVMLLMSISGRNNALNDQLTSHNTALNEQLIKILMERQAQPAVQQPVAAPQNDAALKALTETMTNLQKQIGEQQMRMIEQQNKVAEAMAQRKAADAAAAPASAASISEMQEKERKLKAEYDRLKKANDRLAEEKAKLEKEKKYLHEKEVELQRRKLYPEYYERLEREAAEKAKPQPTVLEEQPAMPRQPAATKAKSPSFATPPPPPSADADDVDDDDIIGNILRSGTKAAKPKAPEPPAPPAVEKPKVLSDGTIRYFDDDAEDMTLPVNVGGQQSGWSVPLD